MFEISKTSFKSFTEQYITIKHPDWLCEKKDSGK
jgi:hypothetical protein